jgi:glycosyltransferase involved in cell wall biosynthesis
VLDGVTGVALVPPGDPGSLARALVATLEDPGASNRALAGGAAIATRFTPERSLATFRRAVDGIVPIQARSDG